MDYIIKHTDTIHNGQFTIKPYTTNGPALPSTVTPLNIHAVAANTSLVLLGKGMYDYGDIIASNFLHLLENFSNSTPPAYPVQGQLWYKNDTNELFVHSDGNFTINSPMVVLNKLLRVNLDVNANRVVNVADPVNPQDAVTKNYLVTTYVNRSGDIMTTGANLTFDGGEVLGLPDTPSSNNAASSKKYVDNQILATLASVDAQQYLHTSGGTMTGPVTMAANTPIYLPTPTLGFNLDGEVVNKKYVDTALLNISTYVQKSGDTMIGTFVINSPAIGGVITTDPILTINGSTKLNGNFAIEGPTTICDMGLNLLTNVGNPVSNQDAATKYYVDQSVIAAIAGGADGTISSATLLNGTLTLSSTIGMPVVISGFITADHTHTTDSINYNANFGTNTNSILRDKVSTLPNYPSITVSNVINTFDELLYEVITQNDRSVQTISSNNIITVSAPTGANLPITSVITGTAGIITVSGDYTTTFKTGMLFIVTNVDTITLLPVDTFYIVGTSGYNVGLNVTTIQVAGNVDSSTTTSGYITQLHGAVEISGIDTKFVSGSKIHILDNTGTGNGDYTIARISTNMAQTQTYLYMESTTPLPTGVTTSGSIISYTIILPFNYSVERNKLQTFRQGIKQYNSIRGVSKISPLIGTNIMSWASTRLPAGTYSFNIVVDGGAVQSISVNVIHDPYTITAVDPTSNTWTVTGAPIGYFSDFTQFEVVGNATALANGVYTVSNTVTSGTDTTITVSEFIPGTATVSGQVQSTYTFDKLINDIQQALASVYSVAPPHLVWRNSALYIYSPISGVGSSVVVTDVSLLSNIPVTLTIDNSTTGVDYSYHEIGFPFNNSKVIDLLSLPIIGDVYEFINIQ